MAKRKSSLLGSRYGIMYTCTHFSCQNGIRVGIRGGHLVILGLPKIR